MTDDDAMRFALVVLTGLTAMLGSAVPAQADPGLDASFLGALDKAGITYHNGADAVAAAHTACNLMDKGEPELDVIKHVTEKNPGFTITGAAKFTAIAASAYCPQHLNAVGGNGGDGDST